VGAIAGLCLEHGATVIVPVDEVAVRVLAERGSALPAVVAGPTADQYTALCDKSELGGSAERAGVGHPARVVATAGGHGGPWPPLPSVVKTSGVGDPADDAPQLVRVETAHARDAAVDRLTSAGAVAIVEEQVAGTHWTVSGVRDAHGEMRAVACRVLRSFPRGVGMPSIIEAVSHEGPAVDAARRLLDSVDYRGPANVQLFERDGRMLVHDVNLRLPASTLLVMRAGIDLPALGAIAALGRPLPPARRRPRTGLRYVSLVDELRGIATPAPGSGPSRGTAAAELARAVASPGTLVDPPLRDPLWVPPYALAAARRVARRVSAPRAARAGSPPPGPPPAA